MASSDTASELAALQALLHWAYRAAVSVRAPMRAALGAVLLKMSAAPVPPPALRSALELLSAIIAGFGKPTAAHRRLLTEVLMPLHLPAARLDSTTPVLSLYHEALVQCLVRLLSQQPALLMNALPPLMAGWPQPREGNSSKEVLLLHELEAALELAPQAGPIPRCRASVRAPVNARQIACTTTVPPTRRPMYCPHAIVRACAPHLT